METPYKSASCHNDRGDGHCLTAAREINGPSIQHILAFVQERPVKASWHARLSRRCPPEPNVWPPANYQLSLSICAGLNHRIAQIHITDWARKLAVGAQEICATVKLATAEANV